MNPLASGDPFRTGGWLADTDADGLPDETAVRIVLEQPNPVVAPAAAELAARIGLETMGMTFPLVEADAAPRPGDIVVRVEPETGLPPGTGRIDAGGDGPVVIIGSDGAGAAAALRLLARWVPDLPGGGSLPAILARIAEETGAAAELRWLEAGPGPGATAVLGIAAEDGALSEDRLHRLADRTGCRVRRDGPGLLRVQAPGMAADPVPQGAGFDMAMVAEPLDLSRLFTAGQLLEDADGDLVPDTAAFRLDIGPECSPALLAAACDVATRAGLESAGIALPLEGPRTVAIRPGAGRVSLSGDDTVTVEGEAAARWLAAHAPGPDDLGHPLPRAVARLERALGRDGGERAVGETVVREGAWDLEWEVDEVRRIVRGQVLPACLPGAHVRIDVRVSETREIREALREELAALLSSAGCGGEVLVRAVYKSGLAWMLEEVRPLIERTPDAQGLLVRCRAFADPGAEGEWFHPEAATELRLVDPEAADALEKRLEGEGMARRWLEPPIRWLLELYPVDELLPIPPDRVRFDVVDGLGTAYEAEILDGEGRLLAAAGFEPRTAERPYLDRWPDQGLVHPPTGWVRAEVDGAVVADVRVPTDTERVWEGFQRELLPLLEETARADGFDPDRQPFFGALEMEVRASEPDEELPVREERSSSLEALHEDLYFVGLQFMKVLGEKEGTGPLEAPGQILPWIHERPGRGASVRWRLTEQTAGRGGLDAGRPALRVTEVRVHADGSLASASAEVVAEEGGAAIAALSAVSGRLPVPVTCRVRGRDGVAGAVLLAARPGREGRSRPGTGRGRPVRRDEVVGHEGHLELLDGLAELPGVSLWRVGRSVQGRDGWAVEAVLPGGGARRSHAKGIAWKPTLLINARHHGNEPSSTLSALETVRRFAVDPAFDAIRRRVNLVALPFENLDGGDLSWRMQRDHPRWMLHAGRYNALGLEMRKAYGDPAHPASEARMLPELWRRWLPDILVDDHGFPSHEWVQPFSGYIPLWPAYWLPRGLVYVYLRTVESPELPGQADLAARVRGLMEEEIERERDIVDLNATWAGRYRKYAHDWLPQAFPFLDYRSLLVYESSVPPDPAGSWGDWGTDFATLHPEITSLSFVTEVADETAHGPYMEACVRAHEAIDVACLRALAEGDHRLSRRLSAGDAGTWRRIVRERPVGLTD